MVCCNSLFMVKPIAMTFWGLCTNSAEMALSLILSSPGRCQEM
jgi:hypothetical protein